MKSIKTTMIIYSMVLVLSMYGIMSANMTNSMKKLNSGMAQSTSQQRMKGYDDSVKFQVQNVIELLNSIYKKEQSGELTRNEAQAEAISLVKDLRYGDKKDGYFWIDDKNYVLVAHPILPEQEGKNRRDLKDKNGVMIIQEIMKVTSNNKNGGFTEFLFTKSDGVTVKPKRTFSMAFDPWGWVVSTGNYYDDIDAELNAIMQEQRKYAAKSKTKGIIATLFFLVFVLIAAIAFSRKFANRIINTAEGLKKMESGDLTVRLKLSRANDEIYEMRKMVNSFAETMNKVIATSIEKTGTLTEVAGSIDSFTENISDEIVQINEHSKDLSNSALVQKKAVEDTANTMTNMKNLIQELSAKLAVQNDAVSQSSTAIEQLKSNINSISGNVNKFGESFKNLLTSSNTGNQTIDQVIKMITIVLQQSDELLNTNKVIESVASQTNLLAMNAAIEAAHAGEAGRGFSVVAEEIRKLSESTTAQSHAINETLSKVTANIKNVYTASTDAGKVFAGIAEQISKDSSLITEIQTSMDEQNTGSQQIVDALYNMKTISSKILDSYSTMSKSVNGVESYVSNLSELANGLSQESQEIESSSNTIRSNVDKLASLAVENRDIADALSQGNANFIV